LAATATVSKMVSLNPHLVTKELDMETYDPHKTKTEIRQASPRRMNLRVLIFSTAGIIVLFGILYALYAWFQPAP
jgi:hypothetical protein